MNILNRVSFLDRMMFTKHLAVMVKSGVTLSEAIGVVRQQTGNPVFKRVLEKVEKEIAQGQTLKKALTDQRGVFDPVYISLIGVGEESGNLVENLEFLAGEMQKTYEFESKVRGALLYPEIILSVALVMGGGIAIFVLPQLASLFSSLDVALPLPTRILLGISTLMQNYGLVIVPGIFGGIILLILLVRTPIIKPLWHRFVLHWPILGQFIRNSQTASLCRNLGLMLRSGLPITLALQAAEEGTTNLVFRGYVHSLGKSVEKGRSIEDELSGGKYRHVPAIVAKMAGVGERSGKLDETLLYLGDFFADEVDIAAKNLPTVLEPLLLVVIAGVVLFLALSIIGPIYDLTGSVRR